MSDARRDRLVARIAEARLRHKLPLGLKESVVRSLNLLLGLAFPHFAQTKRADFKEISAELAEVEAILCAVAADLRPSEHAADCVLVTTFLGKLGAIRERQIEDAQCIFDGDPAATSVDEVTLTYPGFYGIAVYRLAHELALLGLPLVPRLFAERAHSLTGIDIHPLARIGRKFFIDHGTGVVVGETSTLGNGVKIYQGVTLGALAVSKRLTGVKRHPTLEDNVVVYANATILGGDTVIGHDSVVGANSWVTHSVPPFSIVGRDSEARPRKSTSDDSIDFVI